MTLQIADDGKPVSRSTPRQVLAVVCFAMVLANLDLFIVNVALPDISVEFGHAQLEDLSWVLNGYAIVFASLLVFFGRLCERYRRDRSFLRAWRSSPRPRPPAPPRTTCPAWSAFAWPRRSARR